LNQYLYAYCDEIISEAQGRGWKVEKSEDDKNTAGDVQLRLEKNKPDFAFFNGHGSKETVCGNMGGVLVGLDDAHLLSDMIVFARCCEAVGVLGPAAVHAGCRAFIGYGGFFWVPHSDEYESIPARNPAAKPVLEISNIVGKMILKGKSVQEAVDASQEKASELILKTLVSSEPTDAAVFRALYFNSSGLCFVGSAEAACG
jgi:hypothetical protein